MSFVDRLVALGAYSCAGDILYNGKVLATLRNGEWQLTDAGRKMVDVEDVEVKRVEPARRGRPPKSVQMNDGADENHL